MFLSNLICKVKQILHKQNLTFTLQYASMSIQKSRYTKLHLADVCGRRVLRRRRSTGVRRRRARHRPTTRRAASRQSHPRRLLHLLLKYLQDTLENGHFTSRCCHGDLQARPFLLIVTPQFESDEICGTLFTILLLSFKMTGLVSSLYTVVSAIT